MKRTPEFDPRWAAQCGAPFTTTSELDGLVGAGMKKEALRLVRRLLKAPTIAAPTFAEALSAILTLADSTKPWHPLVESAYERLAKGSRASVRFWMMSIRNVCRDYEGVLRLAPKRYVGKFALLELLWAMGATFETSNKDLMRTLARRLPRLAHQVDNPATDAQLWLCLAEFFAREGDWDKATSAAGLARRCAAFHRNAVSAIAEIHVARALLALRRGLDEVADFRRDFDPETELMIPGNEKAILDEAVKEFRRLQKALEKILPSQRRKELGLG